MPFSEVSNALLITYVASEYSLSSVSKGGFSLKGFLASRNNQFIIFGVVIINIIDQLVGAASLLKDFFERLLHAPKILFAAILYIIVLYADCLRHVPNLSLRKFLRNVGMQFLKMLPIYPFLAVLISFGFMFIISAFEHLHLPLEWLNWPIYYGTLYGPFSLVYFQVKKKLIKDAQTFLPQIAPMPNDFFTRGTSGISVVDKGMQHLRVTHFSKKG
jgi:hypothetical protein